MNPRLLIVLLISAGALVTGLWPRHPQPSKDHVTVESPKVATPTPAWFKRHKDLYGRIDHTLAAHPNP